jgi:tetratricopeptide (TPR) repeat protein
LDIPPPNPPERIRATQWITAALIAATLLVYFQTTSFDFTRYDDNYFVTENPVVQQGLSLKNFFWAFTSLECGTWQPVTWITHMLDCQLFGLNAGGHHLANVIYHLVSSILLFWLLSRLTQKIYPSAFVAALFALHPLHVESVAWVGERRDVLSTIWWILTMSMYANWVVRRGAARYLLVVICFSAGLMSKPMLVSLPLILLLVDIWPLKKISLSESSGSQPVKRKLWCLITEKLPLFALAVGMSTITMIAVRMEGSLGSANQYPMAFRIENALVTYVKYLMLTAWPVGLIPHYPYPSSYPFWQVAGSFGILLGVSIFCLRNLNKRPYLGVGWFWFLIAMFPVIGLVQQGSGFAMADRYTYVPLIGIFIMIAWGSIEVANKFAWPNHVLAVAAGLVLIVCAVLSYIQTGYWRNTETLFSYTLAESPGNHVALQQLGVEYRERGEFEKAYAFLVEDVQLNPDNLAALANFGQLLDRMGRLGEAIEYHQRAIKIAPFDPELHMNLGLLKARQGDLFGAQTSLNRALELQPNFLPARINLGLILYLVKEYDAAAYQFSLVLRDNPQSADAHNGLGLIKMAQGLPEEAFKNFSSALRFNPGLQTARDNLQKVQVLLGKS